MSIRHIVILMAFAVFGALPGFSGVLDQLSGSDVRVATHLRDIDAGAVVALKRAFSYEHRLADRGASFSATDVRSAGDPPSRRLVLAAASGDSWFIHYEHGGRGLRSHPVTLARSGRSWRIVYSASAFYTYDTLPRLRAAIRAKKFRSDTDEL